MARAATPIVGHAPPAAARCPGNCARSPQATSARAQPTDAHAPAPPRAWLGATVSPFASQGVAWKGKFYNGMGPGLPTSATFLAS